MLKDGRQMPALRRRLVSRSADLLHQTVISAETSLSIGLLLCVPQVPPNSKESCHGHSSLDLDLKQAGLLSSP